ncbi:MAG: DUF1286 domain-containing protein [Sulfolobales archaeon]
MKMLTHILFTFALASSLCIILVRDVWVLNQTFLLSLLINYLIDVLGHSNRRRTPITHEITNNALVSIIIGLIIYLVAFRITSFSISITIITSLISSFTHLLLDSLTGGIYMVKTYGLVRFCLSSRGYDDFLLNTLFISVSVCILAAVIALIL